MNCNTVHDTNAIGFKTLVIPYVYEGSQFVCPNRVIGSPDGEFECCRIWRTDIIRFLETRAVVRPPPRILFLLLFISSLWENDRTTPVRNDSEKTFPEWLAVFERTRNSYFSRCMFAVKSLWGISKFLTNIRCIQYKRRTLTSGSSNSII